jgi:hypothetical protein
MRPAEYSSTTVMILTTYKEAASAHAAVDNLPERGMDPRRNKEKGNDIRGNRRPSGIWWDESCAERLESLRDSSQDRGYRRCDTCPSFGVS